MKLLHMASKSLPVGVGARHSQPSKVQLRGRTPIMTARRRVGCLASQQPFNQEPVKRQFDQLGFVRVRLERVTTTKQGHYGYLVFVRYDNRRPWLGGRERGLVVHITGDTLYCLCKLLRNEPTARPMPLDILSGILNQASSQTPAEWGLVRVAITDLQHDTYIATVYFGNRRTGEISWELDIRPSDATYLAEQWKVPFYINTAVWEQTAITHSELQQSERDSDMPFTGKPKDDEADVQVGGQKEPVKSQDAPMAQDLAGILPSDPELVKMLKRQLAIAVAEENYSYAAKLRDSPLMKLHLEVQRLKASGDYAAALVLQDKFDAAAAGWKFDGSP